MQEVRISHIQRCNYNVFIYRECKTMCVRARMFTASSWKINRSHYSNAKLSHGVTDNKLKTPFYFF